LSSGIRRIGLHDLFATFNTMDTDTPRTDEAEEESFRTHNNSITSRAAGWEYARELERELNEMIAKQSRKYGDPVLCANV